MMRIKNVYIYIILFAILINCTLPGTGANKQDKKAEPVPGASYYVAVNGNDSHPGTFEQPFATWQKAVEVSKPGDITYIRGGVYSPKGHIMVGQYETPAIGMFIRPVSNNIGSSGTKDAPICYYNYPGEKPVLDGSLVSPNKGYYNIGLDMGEVQYVRFKGLTIRSVYQKQKSGSHPPAIGINSAKCANLYFENITVHDIHGRGFDYLSGASIEPGEEHFPFREDRTSWINCDAYDLYDKYDDEPGNAADGWMVHGSYINYLYLEGCRAWNFSDDGFSIGGQAFRHLKNCWSMSTDKYQGLSSEWKIEGNGFKLPGINPVQVPTYSLGGDNYLIVEGCIAANCIGPGFYNNLRVDHNINWPNNGIYRNNFAYKTGGNFRDDGSDSNLNDNIIPTRTTDYRNNIAYSSTYPEEYNGKNMYEVRMYRPSIYPHSNNSWIGTMKDNGWPGWKDNPDYTVTNDDFVSLDYWQLIQPRKPDGSLPDITFAHLAAGSDLIDGGIVIPGYHSKRGGSSPDPGTKEWYGSAPDLGPFEFNE